MVLALNIHYSRASDLVRADHLVTSPSVPGTAYRASATGAAASWRRRAASSTDALVNDTGVPDIVVLSAVQTPVEQLPESTLAYLLGSRYCDTDELSEIAWQRFGASPTGWARVQTICDFVHHHIKFGYQHARSTRTALEAYREGQGVCLDYAHLAIAFRRCMNIPSRYCTGYLGDVGTEPPTGQWISPAGSRRSSATAGTRLTRATTHRGSAACRLHAGATPAMSRYPPRSARTRSRASRSGPTKSRPAKGRPEICNGFRATAAGPAPAHRQSRVIGQILPSGSVLTASSPTCSWQVRCRAILMRAKAALLGTVCRPSEWRAGRSDQGRGGFLGVRMRELDIDVIKSEINAADAALIADTSDARHMFRCNESVFVLGLCILVGFALLMALTLAWALRAAHRIFQVRSEYCDILLGLDLDRRGLRGCQCAAGRELLLQLKQGQQGQRAGYRRCAHRVDQAVWLALIFRSGTTAAMPSNIGKTHVPCLY
ncbi:transglutaminase-like domain-containing protein [Variovorax sp. GT1P44]|uniref:transglutaminase-like domain-containing protein n=1 Tax=Variovorax sp. GT1P44 TaxID=3443742 RepID=UPI003F46F7C6